MAAGRRPGTREATAHRGPMRCLLAARWAALGASLRRGARRDCGFARPLSGFPWCCSPTPPRARTAPLQSPLRGQPSSQVHGGLAHKRKIPRHHSTRPLSLLRPLQKRGSPPPASPGAGIISAARIRLVPSQVSPPASPSARDRCGDMSRELNRGPAQSRNRRALATARPRCESCRASVSTTSVATATARLGPWRSLPNRRTRPSLHLFCIRPLTPALASQPAPSADFFERRVEAHRAGPTPSDAESHLLLIYQVDAVPAGRRPAWRTAPSGCEQCQRPHISRPAST